MRSILSYILFCFYGQGFNRLHVFVKAPQKNVIVIRMRNCQEGLIFGSTCFVKDLTHFIRDEMISLSMDDKGGSLKNTDFIDILKSLFSLEVGQRMAYTQKL